MNDASGSSSAPLHDMSHSRPREMASSPRNTCELSETATTFSTAYIAGPVFFGLAIAWYLSRRQTCLRGIRHKSEKQEHQPHSQQSKLEEQWRRKQDFLSRVSKDYGYRNSPRGFIDTWRSREFPSLIAPITGKPSTASAVVAFHHDTQKQLDYTRDQEPEVYVDYAGSALASRSQLESLYQDAMHTILGNPHSSGPAAARTKRLMEQAKKRVLDHFQGSSILLPSKQQSTWTKQHPGYEVLFTSGATEALRIVAEHFPWFQPCHGCPERDRQPQSLFIYSQKAHTSVIGMRGSAMASGANFLCLLTDQCLIETLGLALQQMDNLSCAHCFQKSPIHHLVVLTLECNFGGDRLSDIHSLVQQLRALSTDRHSITILMDISKAACTGPINLCQLDADLACVSFYKLFGEPTGVGCLFIKQSAVERIFGDASSGLGKVRRYFGGGSVDIAIPAHDYTVLRNEPTPLARLSNGTCNFRGIVSLLHGFDELDKLGGLERIRRHALSLTRELVRRLAKLRHPNGRPVVVLYGAWGDSNTLDKTHDTPGPTVAFNIIRDDGSFVGYNEVSKLAALNRPPIQLRTGCFCNPGACQDALGQSLVDIRRNYEQMGHVCGDQVDIIDGRPTGAVRVSFGKESVWEDMDAVVSFIQQLFIGSVSRNIHCRLGGRPREVQLSKLYVFPIKSCAAQRVHRWKMVGGGRLLCDREFTLVDSSGTAMRLQSYPKMAYIQPQLDIGSMTMRVSAPGCNDLVLNLRKDSKDSARENTSAVKVCGNRCGGEIWGDVNVSDWFSKFLGVRCWLARYMGDSGESVDQQKSINRYIRSPGVAFANEQPLLLISQEAINKLNTVLMAQGDRLVASRHFRPNIVVSLVREQADDSEQCHEDSWKTVSLVDQGVEFQVSGPCARCSMVEIDPSSGMKGNTLRAMASYRRENGQITFGIFLRATNGLETPKERDGFAWISEGDRMLCT